MVRIARRPSPLAAVLAAVLLLGLTLAAPAAAATSDRLRPGQTLAAGEDLTSADGRYRLTLQTDGNLVLRSPGRTMWNTGTQGTGDGARLTLQTDGNLVLRAANARILWASATTTGALLLLGDDGDLVLTNAAGTTVWHSATPGPTLGAGQSIGADEAVVSADRRYRLTFTAAGDLVLTGPGRTLWSTRTSAAAGTVTQQTDGNLVVRDTAGHAVWASGTQGRPGAVLTVAAARVTVGVPGGVVAWATPTPPATLPVGTALLPGESLVSAARAYTLTLQTDGNLVVRGPGGTAGWATWTQGHPAANLLVQTDGNLVLRTTAGPASWASGTRGHTAGALTIGDDGHLVLRDARGVAVWGAWARSAGLTAAVSAAAAFGAGSGERTAVAVLDRVTGLLYAAGDVNSSYASASLVKVFIAARLLSQNAQADPATANLMYRMITLSDDDAATQLWPRAGGAGVTDWVQARYGIAGLGHPSQAGWWGLTQVTATAMVRFYAAIKADPAVGPWLTNAMANAANHAADGWNQWFGIPSATSGWKVKQGWMCCLDNRSRLHSTGFLAGDRYTAAILTDGSTGFYGQRGADVVTGEATRLLPGRTVPA